MIPLEEGSSYCESLFQAGRVKNLAVLELAKYKKCIVERSSCLELNFHPLVQPSLRTHTVLEDEIPRHHLTKPEIGAA